MVRPVDVAGWHALLDEQDGLVSRAQCRRHGITADQIRRIVGKGLWQRIFPSTFLTRIQPSTHELACRAGLLEVGGLTSVSHESALWLADPSRRPPDLVHVGVVEGRHVEARAGLRVHWLPDLGEERVLWGSDLPRVRPAAAALDVLHATAADDARIRVLSELVSRGVVTLPGLRATLEQRPRMRARALLLDLIAEVEEGALSPLEIRDLRNDRRHGLAAARRQVPRRRGDRRDILDVVYDGNGLQRAVIKELDGRIGHADDVGRWRDMGRDNAAEERGESHLRYGWRDIVGRPCEVAAQIHRVLRRYGWRSDFRRCGPSCAA